MSSISLQIRVSVLCAVVLLGIVALPALAQERTTPVTVSNLLGIDPNNNTVKAQQLGSWSVAVSSMPTISVNTHPVTQSGTWNAAVTGSVSVTNSPTVAISSTANVVKSPTMNSKTQLFLNTQEVAPGASASSVYMDCSGYKELRIVVGCTRSDANVKVNVWFEMANGGWITMVQGNTATPAKTIADTGNAAFVWGGTCAMIVPVMSTRCYISVRNESASPVTVYNWSYIYMVN